MRRVFSSFAVKTICATLLAACLAIWSLPAMARVAVSIDLSNQRMHVESASGSYDWAISSARSGFYTPGGSYAPTHLERMHYSKKYHMSPMPYSIFFRGGFAIHGTYATSELGRPASHGCVRLSRSNAAALYAMVRAEGARISIYGTPPASRPFMVAKHGHHKHYASAGTRHRAAPQLASSGQPAPTADIFGLFGGGGF